MWGSCPPKYLALYAKVFLVISTIYSTAFVIQGSFLKNWDKNLSFSVKSELLTREKPLIYVIKIHKHRSTLRKLIRKLRIFSTNKNVHIKLKVLVAFLSNQKIGRQLGLLPHPFFLKIFRSKLRENYLAKIN